MSDTREIVKSLDNIRGKLKVIIDGLNALDTTSDDGTNRLMVNRVSLTMFEVVDELVNTETAIYNFLMRRGRNELCSKENIKS